MDLLEHPFHNINCGTQATAQKVIIQREIEELMEMGGDGLLEEDQWMLKVNLGDLENTSGEREEYWLLAIKATRAASMLTREHTNAAPQWKD